MKKYDVVALGELLIDFTYYGQSTQNMSLFEQNPGGAPANVLSAVANLGGKTAFIGKVGKDMHGEFLHRTLKEQGIDTKNLIIDESVFTSLAFVSLSQSGERSFSFARKPGADYMLSPDEIDEELICNSKVFQFGSLSLTNEPAASATMKALECAMNNKVTISYDPNYRAMLWKDKETASNKMRAVLDYVNIIKISDEEISLLTNQETPEYASLELLKRGISCVIITLGKDGALVRTKDGFEIVAAPIVEVVDTTGAGDSFLGGFLYCLTKDNILIENLTIEKAKEYVKYANAVASICIGKRGSICIMPNKEQVNHFLMNLKS